MNLYFKYDTYLACRKILEEQFEKFHLSYNLKSFWEVELNVAASGPALEKLISGLNDYGIQIVENPKNILVQKIKDAIIKIVYMDEELPTLKTSSYLAEKLNYKYSYLSNVFAEVTYSSIERYYILQKIERAKELLIANEFTVGEIAWKLNFSSLAHFSNQFKNVTGLTPTIFQRIIKKRVSAKTSHLWKTD